MPPKPGGGIKRKDTLSTLMANEPDDLSQLLSLDEDSVRDALHARYDKQKIYTYINTLLVAMNPYQLLPIYGEDMLAKYTEYGAPRESEERAAGRRHRPVPGRQQTRRLTRRRRRPTHRRRRCPLSQARRPGRTCTAWARRRTAGCSTPRASALAGGSRGRRRGRRPVGRPPGGSGRA